MQNTFKILTNHYILDLVERILSGSFIPSGAGWLAGGWLRENQPGKWSVRGPSNVKRPLVVDASLSLSLSKQLQVRYLRRPL